MAECASRQRSPEGRLDRSISRFLVSDRHGHTLEEIETLPSDAPMVGDNRGVGVRRRYSSSIRLAVSLASSNVSTKCSSGTRRSTFSA